MSNLDVSLLFESEMEVGCTNRIVMQQYSKNAKSIENHAYIIPSKQEGFGF